MVHIFGINMALSTLRGLFGFSDTLVKVTPNTEETLFCFDQEKDKAVPILSSSAYGHRKPLEPPSRQHVRVGLIKRDFYRACGPNGRITDYT